MADFKEAIIKGYTSDTETDGIRVDLTTHTLQVIPYEHHEVHAGASYHCSDIQNVNTTTVYYMITTPDTTSWAHMMFGVESTGEMQVVVTEGADRTGTTALTAINHNRNSANTSGLVIHRDYTSGTTDGATTIIQERLGATGVGAKTIATSDSGHSQEFILKQNTKYIIAITTYADVYISLELDWYEHTNKS
jgi:hypothetical protein